MKQLSDISAYDIATSLGGAKSTASGYVCLCPGHSDEKPSLSVTDSTGSILVHCFAGCSQDALVSILKERGIWPSSYVTTYDYKDGEGNLLFQVCRGFDKSFKQRRPDGNGDWIWKVSDIDTKVPYALPMLKQALELGETICIAEGEKDCDNLHKLGLVATTNNGGAGRWTGKHSEYLRGASQVYILPDNDDAGRRHAMQVATALDNIQVPVKIVELPGIPDKGDVSDFIKAGGTKDQLLQLCSQAEAWNQRQKIDLVRSPSAWSTADSFGEIIPFGEKPLPEITSEFLPPVIKEFVDSLAQRTQTPVGAAAMLVLPVLACCVQTKVEVSSDGGDYREPLSLWALVAMPPASRKSAVLEALLQPLCNWETEQAQLLAPEIERRSLLRAVMEKRIDDLVRRASKLES